MGEWRAPSRAAQGKQEPRSVAGRAFKPKNAYFRTIPQRLLQDVCVVPMNLRFVLKIRFIDLGKSWGRGIVGREKHPPNGCLPLTPGMEPAAQACDLSGTGNSGAGSRSKLRSHSGQGCICVFNQHLKARQVLTQWSRGHTQSDTGLDRRPTDCS